MQKTILDGQQQMTVRRPQLGFTMIEILVTLVVFAILVGIGIPSFRVIIQNSRASALANDLSSAINLARSEAVTRATTVRLCPSSDSATCTGTWQDGWIVMVPDTAEVLRVWSDISTNVSVTQTGTAGAIDFGSLGQRETGATTLTTAAAGCTLQRARDIAVAPSGRIAINRADCP